MEINSPTQMKTELGDGSGIQSHLNHWLISYLYQHPSPLWASVFSSVNWVGWTDDL